MPPVVAAVSAVASAVSAAFTATGSFLAATLINAGISTAAAKSIAAFAVNTVKAAIVSTALSLLAPAPPSPVFQDPGRQLRFAPNANGPRRFIYGETLVTGQPIFEKTVGTDREELHLIIALGDGGPYESIEEITLNGETLTLDGSGNVTAPARYVGFCRVLTYLGSESQTASTQAVAELSEWTTNHRLRGVCYAYVKLTYDRDAWPAGQPLFRFKVRGRKVYDPRLDSTEGGSGTHRKDDPTTWEWSDNPALWLRDYLAGIDMNGSRVGGLGLDNDLINLPSFADAADVCDESVAVNGGGTIARYSGGGGEVGADDDPKAVVQAMAASMAGEVLPRSGYVTCFAGAARTATVTLSDDDLAGPVSVETVRSVRETVNRVVPQYREPDETYDLIDAPAYSEAAWVTADGLTIEKPLPIPFCDDHRRAQRIAKISANRARVPVRLSATFNMSAVRVREGDAFNWSSDRFPSGLTGKFICTKSAISLGGVVQIEARQESDTFYDWTAATDEQARTAAGDIAENVNTFPAAQYPGLGDLAGQDDVAWGTDITGRPTELTDGRITTALNSSGVLLTNIPNASQIPNLTLSQITDSGALAPLNTVGTAQIDAGAVTEAKIGTGAVTETKIGAGAVTEAKIGAGAVTTAKLDDAAVQTAKIQDNAVTNSDQTTTTTDQTTTTVQTIEFARHTQTLTSGSKAIIDYRVFADNISASATINVLAVAASPTLDIFLDLVRDPDGTPTTLESRQLGNNFNNVSNPNIPVGYAFLYEDTSHGGGSTTYALEIRAVENGTSTLDDMSIFWANITRSIAVLETKK